MQNKVDRCILFNVYVKMGNYLGLSNRKGICTGWIYGTLVDEEFRHVSSKGDALPISFCLSWQQIIRDRK